MISTSDSRSSATEKHYVLISKISPFFWVLAAATRRPSWHRSTRAGTGLEHRLRNGRRVQNPALVLVAHQCWSEIVAMAVAAAMTIALSRVSFSGNECAGLCEDGADHRPGDDHRVVTALSSPPPNLTRRWSRSTARPSHCVRMAAHCGALPELPEWRDAPATHSTGDGRHSGLSDAVRHRVSWSSVSGSGDFSCWRSRELRDTSFLDLSRRGWATLSGTAVPP